MLLALSIAWLLWLPDFREGEGAAAGSTPPGGSANCFRVRTRKVRGGYAVAATPETEKSTHLMNSPCRSMI